MRIVRQKRGKDYFFPFPLQFLWKGYKYLWYYIMGSSINVMDKVTAECFPGCSADIDKVNGKSILARNGLDSISS